MVDNVTELGMENIKLQTSLEYIEKTMNRIEETQKEGFSKLETKIENSNKEIDKKLEKLDNRVDKLEQESSKNKGTYKVIIGIITAIGIPVLLMIVKWIFNRAGITV